MATFEGVPGAGAALLGENLFTEARDRRHVGFAMRQAAIAQLERRRQALHEAFAMLRQRRDVKKAQEERGPFGALGGAAAGAGIGALLAAPTGGVSLGVGALMGGGLGANLGNVAFPSAGGANLGPSLNTSAVMLDRIQDPLVEIGSTWGGVGGLPGL